MKVVFLTAEGYHMPGARVRSYRFAKILGSRGIDASVLSMADDFGAPDGEDLQLMGNLGRIGRVHRAMRKLRRSRNLKIVLQRAKYPALAVYFLSREEGIPYVFDYDDWELNLENFFLINRIPWLKNLSSTAPLTESLARGAQRCVAASRRLETLLKSWNNDVRYIPTGVDTDQFRPANKHAASDTVSFVWTGLVWGEYIYRNLLEVAEGLDRARRSGSRLRLVLIGGGTWMPVLTRALEHRFPDLDVRFEGWRAAGEMHDRLAEMHVGLMPLIADTRIEQWIESKSPTKMFEYMAAGLPVIGSRNGEIKHILTDGEDGFLVDSPQDIAEAASRLAADHGLRTRMGEAAREKVEAQYSLKALADPLMEAIVGN